MIKPKEDSNPITFSQQTIWIENGIMYIQIAENAVINIEEAKASSKYMKEVSKQPIPIIVYYPKGHTQSIEARNFYAKDPEHIKLYTACALLTDSPMGKVLANFFMGFNKPLKPTRMFTDLEAAEKWIDSFKTEN
ncbi:MAG: hypothetical protein OEW67_01145 [Cyclobacteriaceae bacterium]|nr:hypothetical protein [Cyclobacteriaceae bacterium]